MFQTIGPFFVTQSEAVTVIVLPSKYSEGTIETDPPFGGAPVLQLMLFLIVRLPWLLGLMATDTTYSVFSAQLP